jgi:hypothetical protein
MRNPNQPLSEPRSAGLTEVRRGVVIYWPPAAHAASAAIKSGAKADASSSASARSAKGPRIRQRKQVVRRTRHRLRLPAQYAVGSLHTFCTRPLTRKLCHDRRSRRVASGCSPVLLKQHRDAAPSAEAQLSIPAGEPRLTFCNQL